MERSKIGRQLAQAHIRVLIRKQEGKAHLRFTPSLERYLPRIDLFRSINETEEYPDYSVAYVAGALTQTLIHWFRCGFKPEISAVSRITEDIISGKVYQGAMPAAVTA